MRRPVGPGPREEPGSTFAGFHVAHSERPRRWCLDGAHRFSRYALEFRLDELAPDRTYLCAETRAVFPGLDGAFYRMLVIGSGGHREAVRRMLLSVKRRAEEDPAESAESAEAVEADSTTRPPRG
jgi:hypothetical protein